MVVGSVTVAQNFFLNQELKMRSQSESKEKLASIVLALGNGNSCYLLREKEGNHRQFVFHSPETQAINICLLFIHTIWLPVMVAVAYFILFTFFSRLFRKFCTTHKEFSTV